MKKSLLLLSLMSFVQPNFSLFSGSSADAAGEYSDHKDSADEFDELMDQNSSDSDNDFGFDSQDESENQHYFKKSHLVVRTSTPARSLFLAAFFSAVRKTFKELEYSCGGYGHADMMAGSARASIFHQLSQEKSLKQIMREVLDPAICTQEFTDQLITKIIEQTKVLFDEGEKFFKKINGNNDDDDDDDEIEDVAAPRNSLINFCEQALVAIFSCFPEHELEKFPTSAGKILCLENFLMNSHQSLANVSNNPDAHDKQFEQASFIYDGDAFKKKLAEFLTGNELSGFLNHITEKYTQLKNDVFKDFAQKNINNLNNEENEAFIKLSGEAYRTIVDELLSAFGSNQALRAFKPYSECFM